MNAESSSSFTERHCGLAGAPIRVLHVISGLGVGGAESMLVNLAIGGKSVGLESRVVSLLPGGTNAGRLAKAGIQLDSLDMKSGRPSLRAIGKLAYVIRDARPDVVQSWMYHADLLAWVARTRLPVRFRPRLVWGIRCSDMRVTEYGRQLRWVISICAKLSRRPDMIIANSEAGRDVHQGLGYRNSRFEVIANGIDVDRFRPDRELRLRYRAEFGIADDQVAVALVARVDPMKDHASFLAAMAQNPALKGILIGRDTEKLELPANVVALGARPDVHELLPACDVVALSSAFGEGFPNALGEGMAAGLVPVATDVGDCRRMIGDTGNVTAPRDIAGFADALDQAAELAGAGHGAAARRRIESTFALPAAIHAFRDAYADVLGRPCAD